MTDNQVEDFFKQFNSENYTIILSLEKDENKEELSEQGRVLKDILELSYLKELGLIKEVIKKNKSARIIHLTPKGRKVLRVGGWKKYMEREDEIEQKKQRKENYDLKISEFQANNPRLPYLLSVFSIIIAGISLFVDFKTDKNEDNLDKENIILQKTERQEKSKEENTTLPTVEDFETVKKDEKNNP